MFFDHPEKRNYPRIDAEIDVDIVIEGKKMNATSANISCGGMFIPVRKHILKERTDMEITLHLPENGKPVTVVGKVARIEAGSLFRRQKPGVAIRFTGLYDDHILALEKFIKKKVH